MKMKDIAAQAGVSTATVSNVINGNHHKVSEDTIKKIQQIIEENDYKPNATARSLALKESKIISVVVANMGEDEDFAMSPYNSEVLALLEKYVRKQGYYLMIRVVKKCREVIPISSAWNVDGIILLGANIGEIEEIEATLQVPTVYLDSYMKDVDIANVGIDDYKGGFMAARYLMGKGHRKIAIAGPDINSSEVVMERYRGFCDACRERQVEVTPDCLFESPTIFENGIELGKQIAFSDRGFTAVAAMSDILAAGIMEGLRISGLNVPEHVSVIGFDNLPMCVYTNPKLTTISQNLEEKVKRAGAYLFEMIQNKEKIVVNDRIDVGIVERQSVKQLIL